MISREFSVVLLDDGLHIERVGGALGCDKGAFE
jgi:hypothetical protein